MMSCRQEQMLCTIVIFLTAATGFADTAAFLITEIIKSLTFDITLMADRYDNIFFSDQIFHIHGRSIM